MKNKLSLYLCFLVLGIGFYPNFSAEAQQTETRKKYSADGKLEEESSFVKGDTIRHGVSRWFYPNGKVQFEMPYKMHKRNGLARYFYESGAKEREEYYTDGKRNGVSKYFNESGNLEIEMPYKNGVPEGLARTYYPSGAKESEENYRNGKPDGLSVFYYENGNPRQKISYQNGAIVKREDFDESGKTIDKSKPKE